MKAILAFSIFIFSSVILFCVTPLKRPTDTDGNGYLNISTLSHLRWLSESPQADLSADYELDNDIDASETREWNVGDHDKWSETPDTIMGFKPIGESWKNPFTGKFEGNYYKISNLYINRPGYFEIGLFGIIKQPVEIKNLVLIEIDINGGTDVGSLVGSNGDHDLSAEAQGGIIQNCSAFGSIKGQGRVGGLVGLNYGFVRQSFAKAEIFVSRNTGGGLVGYNHDTIRNSFAISTVNGENFLGGLIGEEEGKSIHSYSASTTERVEISGGLLSVRRFGHTIECYWDSEKTNQKVNTGGSPRTTAEMKTQSNYVDWDFDNIWAIDPNINDGYPYLRGLSSVF